MYAKLGMMRPNDICSAAYYGDQKKITELVMANIEPVEEEPPLEADFDPTAPADEEAIAAAKDRAARRAANEKEIAERVSRPNFLVTRQSPVNKSQFGLFVRAVERDLTMVIQYKASKKSPFTACPLHWAVLGREHGAVEQLIMLGADPTCKVPELGVTIYDICKANQSLETLEVIARTVAKFKAAQNARREAAEKREALLVEREHLRKKAVEDAAAKELEERLAAEREAAGEAAAAPDDNLPEVTEDGEE
jgi:hypothetical protein